jgi:hypothetical protein
MHRIAAFLVLSISALLLPPTVEAQFGYPPMYPGYPGYPGYRYGYAEADVRLMVKPVEASVYVDGYFAGKVDDFDGRFQRLHVPPGEHEIVVHLEGYRSLRQKLYLNAHATRKIEGTLEKLTPGETQDPVPVPAEPRADAGGERGRPYPPFAGDPRTRRRPPAPASPPPPGGPATPASPSTQSAPSRAAVLSIRVQPAGATVFIDGERWSGPDDGERLIVQVPDGRRRIEVEREGYERFSTEIDVLAGQTVPVNINLTRAR